MTAGRGADGYHKPLRRASGVRVCVGVGLWVAVFVVVL